MTTIINPKCPKCGNVLTVKLNMIDRLQARIRELEKHIADMKGLDSFKSIFGGTFK